MKKKLATKKKAMVTENKRVQRCVMCDLAEGFGAWNVARSAWVCSACVIECVKALADSVNARG